MSISDFNIQEKLGDGAYSSVYKVLRITDNKEYAMKKVKLERLKEKEKENALNEIRILASIQHPHIIAYKQAFIDETSSCLCLITEVADGGDLFQKIQMLQKLNSFLAENDIWKIFIQTVFALKKLHDMKIYHRDIKSANVFLFNNGFAKLGDMNVSKVAKKGLLLTQTGTPYYASPEVWKDYPYDYKSDIWSLGCVLYEMIALKPPFQATDMEGLYKKVMTGKYPQIPSIFSSELSSIIKSMLQLNSKHRPTCLTLLNMDIIKKKIEKYFGADYLLSERQTYQGQIESSLKQQDVLFSTIRLTENLFSLKDKLPESAYSLEEQEQLQKKRIKQKEQYQSIGELKLEKKKQKSLHKLKVVKNQDDEELVNSVAFDNDDNALSGKILLSYITPHQNKEKEQQSNANKQNEMNLQISSMINNQSQQQIDPFLIESIDQSTNQSLRPQQKIVPKEINATKIKNTNINININIINQFDTSQQSSRQQSNQQSPLNLQQIPTDQLLSQSQKQQNKVQIKKIKQEALMQIQKDGIDGSNIDNSANSSSKQQKQQNDNFKFQKHVSIVTPINQIDTIKTTKNNKESEYEPILSINKSTSQKLIFPSIKQNPQVFERIQNISSVKNSELISREFMLSSNNKVVDSLQQFQQQQQQPYSKSLKSSSLAQLSSIHHSNNQYLQEQNVRSVAIKLLNNINSFKKEQVPLSYLRGKQSSNSLVQKQQLKNIVPNQELKQSLIGLPELRGLSLESYKYIQEISSPRDQIIKDKKRKESQQIISDQGVNQSGNGTVHNQRYLQNNLNYARDSMKIASQEIQKKQTIGQPQIIKERPIQSVKDNNSGSISNIHISNHY